jgi:hypothetical protein
MYAFLLIFSRHGKINFVDLAGSEMTKKTKSEGKTLEEANNINKSLMVLGKGWLRLVEVLNHSTFNILIMSNFLKLCSTVQSRLLQ